MSTSIFRYIIVLAFASVMHIPATSLKAQDTLSLQLAITKALENNFQMLIAKANVQLAENNNSWGRAGMTPSVILGVTDNNRYDNTESTTSGERQDIYSMAIRPNIAVNWNLFKGFSIQMTKKNYDLLEEIANGNLYATIETTVQRVIINYYNALLQRERMNVFMELMNLSRDRYLYMQERQKLGSAVTFDVLQFRNSYLTDSSNYLLQKITYENSLRNINFLLADTSYVTYELSDSFTVSTPVYDLMQLTEASLNNTYFRLQQLNYQILENNVKINESQLYPSLSLSVGSGYTQNFRQIDNLPSTSTNAIDAYATLSLSYTLFNGGVIRNNIANARIQQDIGQLQLTDFEYQLRNQLISIYELYNARKQVLLVAEQNMEAARLNLQLAEDKYKSGSITSFNYRDIQLLYLNTALNRLSSIYNLIDVKTELLRLSGSLISQ